MKQNLAPGVPLLDDLAERLVIETHYYCLLANNYHLLLHTRRYPAPVTRLLK